MRDKKGFYTRNGKKYISVTTALSIINKPALNNWGAAVGKDRAEEISKAGRDFGKQFHSLCELIDKGEGWSIKLDTLPGAMRELVVQFRDWFYGNVEEVILTEQEVYSDKFLYAGRLDRVYKMKGQKGLNILDVKTGNFLDKTDHWQLAAYKHALKEDKGLDTMNRIILHFNKKDIRFTPLYLPRENDDKDFNGFLCALQTWQRYNKD